MARVNGSSSPSVAFFLGCSLPIIYCHEMPWKNVTMAQPNLYTKDPEGNRWPIPSDENDADQWQWHLAGWADSWQLTTIGSWWVSMIWDLLPRWQQPEGWPIDSRLPTERWTTEKAQQRHNPTQYCTQQRNDPTPHCHKMPTYYNTTDSSWWDPYGIAMYNDSGLLFTSLTMTANWIAICFFDWWCQPIAICFSRRLPKNQWQQTDPKIHVLSQNAKSTATA